MSETSTDYFKSLKKINSWFPLPSLPYIREVKAKVNQKLAEFDAALDSHLHLQQRPVHQDKTLKLPWDDLPAQYQDSLRSEILNISRDRETFLKKPPSDFDFSLPENIPLALALLKLDPNLSKLRYELVPLK
jgi:hypothetical protein